MKKKSMSGVLVLLVFAAFTVSVLLVLLSGADTVQKLTRRDQDTYHHRTAVQYLTTKVRQSDQAGAVSVSETDGCSTLVLTEKIDGITYETRIYCYDGYLRELFCAKGAGLGATFGEEILPREDFQVSFEDGFLSAALCLPDGTTDHVVLQLRSLGGAAE